MRLLKIYVGQEIIKASLLAALGLLSFILLIIFVDEMGRTGKGQYSSSEALLYVLATVPRHIYHIFPPAVLIGTMLGLGVLASNSELVAMRASGISRLQIVRIVISAALLLMSVSIVLGEFIAPGLDSYAETRRSLVMNDGKSLKTNKGIWVRDGNDFIRVDTVLNHGELKGVQVIQTSGKAQLRRYLYAELASYRSPGDWLLQNVDVVTADGDDLRTVQMAEMVWQSHLNPDVMQVVVVRPEVMAADDLFEYSQYLEQNGIDARKYQLAFWSKLATPFATLVMAILAIPFVLAWRRNVSTGNRVLVGTMLGVTFYILNQFAGNASMVYNIPPVLGAFLPSLLFFAVALVLFRKLN
ncbi:MAG: LPS export ABC transporter permease LptG [Gammaproteobacteria bacterium]|nr:LPS export ABC transporter permease LptG [Gammaproteobacteria bacterium]